jgi:hypothetical protein
LLLGSAAQRKTGSARTLAKPDSRQAKSAADRITSAFLTSGRGIRP